MLTKSLTRQHLAAHDLQADRSAINRLLLAAAISSRFCASLLQNPGHTIEAGFGAEKFEISESTRDIMASIQASSLPEFIQQLDQNLANKLLTANINDL